MYCGKHEEVDYWACPHCLDEAKQEIERLKLERAQAMTAREIMPEVIAEEKYARELETKKRLRAEFPIMADYLAVVSGSCFAVSARACSISVLSICGR